MPTTTGRGSAQGARPRRSGEHNRPRTSTNSVPMDALSDLSDDSGDDQPFTIGDVSTVTPASSAHSTDNLRPHRRGESMTMPSQTTARANPPQHAEPQQAPVASSRYEAILKVCEEHGTRIGYTAFSELMRRCNVNADENTVTEHFVRAIEHSEDSTYAAPAAAAREIYALGGVLTRRSPRKHDHQPRSTRAASAPMSEPSSTSHHHDARSSNEPISDSTYGDPHHEAGAASSTVLRSASPLATTNKNVQPPMRFGPPHLHDGLRKKTPQKAPPGSRPLSPEQRNAARVKLGLPTVAPKLTRVEADNLISRLTRKRAPTQRQVEAKIAKEEERQRAEALIQEECTFKPVVFPRSRTLSRHAIGDGTCAEQERFRRPTEAYYSRQAERSMETSGIPSRTSSVESAARFRRDTPPRGRSPVRKPIALPPETPNRKIVTTRHATYDENGAVTTDAECSFRPKINASPRSRTPTNMPKGYHEAICRMRRTPPSSRGSSPNARFAENLRTTPPKMSPALDRRPPSTFGNERYVDPRVAGFDLDRIADPSPDGRTPARVRDGARLSHAVDDAIAVLQDLFGPDFEAEMGLENLQSIARARTPTPDRRHHSHHSHHHLQRRRGSASSSMTNASTASSSASTSAYMGAKMSMRAYIQLKVDRDHFPVADVPLAHAAFRTLQAAILVRRHDPESASEPRTDDHERTIHRTASPHRPGRNYGIDPSNVTLASNAPGVPRYAAPTRRMSLSKNATF